MDRRTAPGQGGLVSRGGDPGAVVWSLVVCEKGGGGHKGDTSPAACPGPRGVGEALDVPVLQAAELLLQAGDALALLRHQRAQRRHLLQHLLQPPARLRTPRVTCQATPPPLGPAHHPRGHAHHPQSPAHHSRGHAHHPRGHAPSHSLSHSLPRRPRPFPKRPRPIFHRPRPLPHRPRPFPLGPAPSLTVGAVVPVPSAGGALSRAVAAGAVGLGAAGAAGLGAAVAAAGRASCSRERRLTLRSRCLLGT